MRGFSFCVAQFVMAGFRKFQVEKSVRAMTVRIKKINTWDSLLKKKKNFFPNGLFNSRCDHSVSAPLPSRPSSWYRPLLWKANRLIIIIYY